MYKNKNKNQLLIVKLFMKTTLIILFLSISILAQNKDKIAKQDSIISVMANKIIEQAVNNPQSKHFELALHDAVYLRDYLKEEAKKDSTKTKDKIK